MTPPVPPELAKAAEDILGRVEFQQYYRQTFWEWVIAHLNQIPYLDQLERWVTTLLAGFATSMAAFSLAPLYMASLVFLLVVLVGGGGYLIWRRIHAHARPETSSFRAVAAVPAPLSAEAWLLEAARSARDRDYRQAIHATYRSALRALDERGIADLSQARTTQEVVRALPPHFSGHLPLDRLTSLFERIWYGLQPCGEDEYRSALQEAEGFSACLR